MTDIYNRAVGKRTRMRRTANDGRLVPGVVRRVRSRDRDGRYNGGTADGATVRDPVRCVAVGMSGALVGVAGGWGGGCPMGVTGGHRGMGGRLAGKLCGPLAGAVRARAPCLLSYTVVAVIVNAITNMCI